MKHILLITTGGTIACQMTDSGLAPALSPAELLSHISYGSCRIDFLPLMNIDSTNMEPAHWLMLAGAIRDNYDAYDAFIIAHGTDTMAYTASALSYLIQNSRKPILLTGAQRPIRDEDTDARINLQDCILYALDDRAHGVCLVFGGLVIAGTRCRKMRTKSYHAFESINHPELARICDGKVLLFIDDKDLITEPVVFYDELCTRVLLLKLVPGTDGELLTRVADLYDAVILESFGVGGLPEYGRPTWENALAEWTAAGKSIFLTTQVVLEGSDMGIYSVGKSIKKKYRLLEAFDMTPEALITKIMWILSRTKQPDEIRRLLYKTINHDILLRD